MKHVHARANGVHVEIRGQLLSPWVLAIELAPLGLYKKHFYSLSSFKFLLLLFFNLRQSFIWPRLTFNFLCSQWWLWNFNPPVFISPVAGLQTYATTSGLHSCGGGTHSRKALYQPSILSCHLVCFFCLFFLFCFFFYLMNSCCVDPGWPQT